MLILLPPSEGKVGARSGRPVDLAALSSPVLTPAREQVLGALTSLCRDDPATAVATLGLSPGLADEVARNARLLEAPAAPAAKVYRGVLYEALDLATLDAPAKRLAGRSLLVFSALWGVVRIGDRIPAYRCSSAVSLPGTGGLPGFWRRYLAPAVEEAAGSGLVLDLRSSGYASMWPPGPLAARTVTVRVLHGGKVVSHFNKATKGRLVRTLLQAGARPRWSKDLAAMLRDLKYTVAETAPNRLDVTVDEL